MRWIDRFAYNNRIHRLDPAYKAGFSLGVIFLCLLLENPHASLALLGLTVSLAVWWAGLPAGFVLRLLLAEGGFLAIGVLGVAVSVGVRPTAGALALGPLWLSVTAETLNLAIILLTRSLGCVAAMNFLAFTTPLVDLIDLLRRMRVSDLLIDLMTLTYRFTFILLDCLERMVQAQEVRLGFNGWRRSLLSAGQIGANLFIEAFRRSQKLELALQGRGWDGRLRVLPQEYEHLAWPWKK
jgi:cobalt/nickel transport system permease protein